MLVHVFRCFGEVQKWFSCRGMVLGARQGGPACYGGLGLIFDVFREETFQSRFLEMFWGVPVPKPFCEELRVKKSGILRCPRPSSGGFPLEFRGSMMIGTPNVTLGGGPALSRWPKCSAVEQPALLFLSLFIIIIIFFTSFSLSLSRSLFMFFFCFYRPRRAPLITHPFITWRGRLPKLSVEKDMKQASKHKI